MKKVRIRRSRLHLNAQHPHKPLTEIEINYRRKFVRISRNGHYRSPKSRLAYTRYANPGRAFGIERFYLNWVHFRRHCFHISLVWRGCRGITFSYGRSLV